MTALQNFHHADARVRRAASRAYHQERDLLRPPALQVESRSPTSRFWALARALRVGAKLLFALWVMAALVFCAAVAVALV